MAKGRAERINILVSASKEELEHILDNIIIHAKTPECMAEMKRAKVKLNLSQPVGMIEAIELDEMIKSVLSAYLSEYLSEESAEIDGGTGLIISSIIDERSSMLSSGIDTDKRSAFKAYKTKYKGVYASKRELKEKFSQKFSAELETINKAKAKTEKLGRAVSAYHINNALYKEENFLRSINDAIESLSERFSASTDEMERARLEAECTSLLASRDKVNLNLAILKQNKANVSGYEDILRGTEILARLENVKSVDIAKINKAGDEYNKALKSELKKQEAVSDALNKANVDSSRAMDAFTMSAKIGGGNDYLAKLEAKKMASKLDNIGSTKTQEIQEIIEDIDIDEIKGEN